jgi:AraC-like DNA-binding protein
MLLVSDISACAPKKPIAIVTPTVYLQNVRMRKAAELLKGENLSVKEARAAIGLESDSYFTHLCERVYGVTPSRMKEFPSS